MIQIILATDMNYGIGYKNDLPWKNIKKDMEFFKEKTTGHIVIMGRNTWESLPDKYKPLPNRYNIVISKKDYEESDKKIPKEQWVNSILESLRLIAKFKKIEENKNKEVFVIGGNQIYNEFIKLNIVHKIWHTFIHKKYDCDLFLDPKIFQKFQKNINNVFSSDELTIHEYQYMNSEEGDYLNLIENLSKNGVYKQNRTGINTYSLFCPKQLRFNLENNSFPLLTTKKCPLKHIFTELNFYLSGKSDSKILESQGVTVWKGNTTRDFLDKRGLSHYKEGDMGPSYSFNFRHYSADYKGCEKDYSNEGFNQVDYCINLIKNEPDSRRIIINLWDPSKLNEMSLPPCMFFYQFYVNNGYLSCHSMLRSSDTFLGLPWNIATASLLTIMLSKVCDLKPAELIMTINDAHIYDNQVEAVKTQISRNPYPFPLLYVKDKKDIYSFEYNDFELLNYHSHESIKVPMII